MGKITNYRCWCLLCCLATQWSFCGKIKSVFLERDASSQEGDDHTFWCEQKSREIEQPQTFFRRNPVVYNRSLFGPSLLDKKECQKSSLKRSPPSDNLLRDSQESDTQSLTSQESDTQSSTSQDTSSQDTSSSEPSRAPTPESSESIVRTAFFHKPRVVAAQLRVIIPRIHVKEEDKPVLLAKLVSSFKSLGTRR